MDRRNFIGSAAAGFLSLACAHPAGSIVSDSKASNTKSGLSHEGHVPDQLRGYTSLCGFNYTPSNAYNDISFWRDYDEGLVERELDYAHRLGLNSARVFFHYVVYEHDRKAFLKRIKHFVKAAHERSISTMPVVWDSCFSEVIPNYDTSLTDWIPNPGVQRLGPDFWPSGERYCQDLIQTIGPEPGLLMWDIMNEPLMTSYVWTNPPDKKQRVEIIWNFVRHFCEVMARLDDKHPRTVGNAFASWITETSDYVDVISFHDYSPNRKQLRDHLSEALQFARQLNKPVLVSEVGCVARNNPYDMTLEICRDLSMGWYVWELMIGVSRWNDIHGIVYPDGAVRDPSIVVAVQGFFRRRKGKTIAYKLDKEGAVTRVLGEAEKWLQESNASYLKGLTMCEEMANLLESGELVPMNRLPSIQVLSRQEETAENIAEVSRLLKEWGKILEAEVIQKS